jgi:enoyl-[acyl-carrier protein] reductase/trans-2-enoyl-CoA reductase (NAD+)
MKEKGLHEGCIEQMRRLFATRLYAPGGPAVDSEGRIRIDDWETRAEVQDAVAKVWPVVSTENLAELTDIAGFQADFLKLFGFGLPGVDYDADVEPHILMP